MLHQQQKIKEKRGVKQKMPDKQKKKYQRTSPTVLCQCYGGHQLSINTVVQVSKENRGQAIICSHRQLEVPALRMLLVNVGVLLAVHGRLEQQSCHILKHKI